MVTEKHIFFLFQKLAGNSTKPIMQKSRLIWLFMEECIDLSSMVNKECYRQIGHFPFDVCRW